MPEFVHEDGGEQSYLRAGSEHDGKPPGPALHGVVRVEHRVHEHADQKIVNFQRRLRAGDVAHVDGAVVGLPLALLAEGTYHYVCYTKSFLFVVIVAEARSDYLLFELSTP